MLWKHGSILSSTLFAKLLITLPNLTELGEHFSEFQLNANVLDQFSFDENHLDDKLDQVKDGLSRSIKIFTIKALADS